MWIPKEDFSIYEILRLTVEKLLSQFFYYGRHSLIMIKRHHHWREKPLRRMFLPIGYQERVVLNVVIFDDEVPHIDVEFSALARVIGIGQCVYSIGIQEVTSRAYKQIKKRSKECMADA